MIEKNNLFDQHKLISEEMEAQITQIFQNLTSNIVLKAILDRNDAKSLELGSLLISLEKCSKHISVELYDIGERNDLDALLEAKHLPVVGLWREDYVGIRFHGVPGGKELNSFISGICACGGSGTPLDKKPKKLLDKLNQPVHMEVFVSLACHHCPHVVAACQKLAVEKSTISVATYDAKLYPDIVEKYDIQRVPITIINSEHKLIGQKTAEEIVKFAQQFMSKN